MKWFLCVLIVPVLLTFLFLLVFELLRRKL